MEKGENGVLLLTQVIRHLSELCAGSESIVSTLQLHRLGVSRDLIYYQENISVFVRHNITTFVASLTQLSNTTGFTPKEIENKIIDLITKIGSKKCDESIHRTVS